MSQLTYKNRYLHLNNSNKRPKMIQSIPIPITRTTKKIIEDQTNHSVIDINRGLTFLSIW